MDQFCRVSRDAMILDASTGAVPNVLKGHNGLVNSVAISEDGKCVRLVNRCRAACAQGPHCQPR